MIRYLTRPEELDELASSETICFPVSLLEQRLPFQGLQELTKRIRQSRLASGSTRIVRRL